MSVQSVAPVSGLVFGVRVRSPGRAARYERMTILINCDKPIDLNRSEDTCTVTSIRLGDGPVLECVVGGALERSAPCAPPERVWPHRSRNRASQGPSVARPGRALPRPGPDFHPTRPRVRPRPAVSQSLMPPMRRGRSGRSIHVDCVCRRLRLLSATSYHLWCP